MDLFGCLAFGFEFASFVWRTEVIAVELKIRYFHGLADQRKQIMQKGNWLLWQLLLPFIQHPTLCCPRKIFPVSDCYSNLTL